LTKRCVVDPHLRDEEVIRRWREEFWPELQERAMREGRVLIFEDESVLSLLPPTARSSSPEGEIPNIREKKTRGQLSVWGGMTLEGKVFALALQEPLNGLHSVEFLRHLLRVAGERLLVIWDGSPLHRCAEVKEFVSGMRGKVWLEPPPRCAPDLNPWDEGGWRHLQKVEMGNLGCHDLEELHQEFHLAVGRLRQKPYLVQSFFVRAGLRLANN
jgi:hypothetical protein